MAKSFIKNWLNLKKNISIYIPIYWIFYRKRSIDGNNSESEDKPNSTDNPGSNSPPKRPKTNCWPQFLRDCTILWQQSSMAISRKKNTKIPWKPWDIPDLFEFMADDISTNGPRRINSYVKNNPYLKQMDIHDNSNIYLMIQKQNPEY